MRGVVVYSFSTSPRPNWHHHTTVLKADITVSITEKERESMRDVLIAVAKAVLSALCPSLKVRGQGQTSLKSNHL